MHRSPTIPPCTKRTTKEMKIQQYIPIISLLLSSLWKIETGCLSELTNDILDLCAVWAVTTIVYKRWFKVAFGLLLYVRAISMTLLTFSNCRKENKPSLHHQAVDTHHASLLWAFMSILRSILFFFTSYFHFPLHHLLQLESPPPPSSTLFIIFKSYYFEINIFL